LNVNLELLTEAQVRNTYSSVTLAFM
jgi:hypothetical protein